MLIPPYIDSGLLQRYQCGTRLSPGEQRRLIALLAQNLAILLGQVSFPVGDLGYSLVTFDVATLAFDQLLVRRQQLLAQTRSSQRLARLNSIDVWMIDVGRLVAQVSGYSRRLDARQCLELQRVVLELQKIGRVDETLLASLISEVLRHERWWRVRTRWTYRALHKLILSLDPSFMRSQEQARTTREAENSG